MKYVSTTFASIVQIVVLILACTAPRVHAQMSQDVYLTPNSLSGAGRVDGLGPGAYVSGTQFAPSVFLNQSTGYYRLRGIAMTSGASLPISNLSTSSGSTMRIILGPGGGSATPNASYDAFLLGNTALGFGHDPRAWLFYREINTSPYNSQLTAGSVFSTTPWDPIFELGPQTMIIYYRINANGDTYIDRFVPYYDADGNVQVSWEEGVQEGAFFMGELGVGTPLANPTKWQDFNFSTVVFGSGSYYPNPDELRTLTLSKNFATQATILADVAQLVPGLNLSQQNLYPCNDGRWLINNVNLTSDPPPRQWAQHPAATSSQELPQ